MNRPCAAVLTQRRSTAGSSRLQSCIALVAALGSASLSFNHRYCGRTAGPQSGELKHVQDSRGALGALGLSLPAAARVKPLPGTVRTQEVAAVTDRPLRLLPGLYRGQTRAPSETAWQPPMATVR
jgi:hypothetical protein